MASLISLHMWFQQRIGSVDALANPCIGINDQVRIFERTTSETYVHYVRSMSTTHDLDTGQYLMRVGTHWMGDESDWAITAGHFPGQATTTTSPGHQKFYLPDDVREYLETSTARSTTVARLNNFNIEPEPTRESFGADTNPAGSPGAADGH